MRYLILLISGLSLASGQSMTPERRQAILDYQLTLPRANSLITAMGAMTKYVASLPDAKERIQKMTNMSPAERLAAIEKDDKAMAIVRQNGLTARDYIVGVVALRMALMAAQGINGPTIVASPANVAFAKANLADLKPKMDAADGIARK